MCTKSLPPRREAFLWQNDKRRYILPAKGGEYMNKNIVWGLIIVAGVLFGWLYFNGDLNLSRPSTKTTIPSIDQEVSETDSTFPAITDESTIGGDMKGGVGEQLTVRLTENGFEPKEITVKSGVSVTFVNDSTKGMWVASDAHPTHQVLPGFDQKKSVSTGGTYIYTFEKIGTWKFHNHVSSEMTGTVIVK